MKVQELTSGGLYTNTSFRNAAKRGAFFVGYLLLAAYFLFAHGCHGDADTELFTTFTAESSSAAASR
jgi:hypothetical protein